MTARAETGHYNSRSRDQNQGRPLVAIKLSQDNRIFDHVDVSESLESQTRLKGFF